MFQSNSLKGITPATLDVMLKVLAADTVEGPTNAQRQEATRLKELVLQCIVRMIHVIHECSPDQVSRLFLCSKVIDFANFMEDN